MSDDILYDHDKLLDFITKHQIKNLLLGNGYCLSHPVLNKVSYWNSEDVLKEIIPEMSKLFNDPNENDCPEAYFLKNIRLYILRAIVKKYIKNFNTLINATPLEESIPFSGWYKNYFTFYEPSYSSQNILRKFEKIFTVNYDPLMYFELLSLTQNPEYTFRDGFKGADFISQHEITSNLDNHNGQNFYFLHGSWFIQINQKKELRKLSFKQDSSDSLESLFNIENDETPLFILEDRNFIKDSLINEYSYLEYCREQLKNFTGKILIFGMSFNNDDHIIEYLKHNTGYTSEVYITYCQDKEYDEKAKEKLEKIPGFKQLIKITNDAIWERKDG